MAAWREGAEATALHLSGSTASCAARWSAPDPALLGLLAHFPLLVNDGGQTTVADAATLSARWRSIFTDAVRTAVLETRIDDVICTGNGIGYGRGAILGRPARLRTGHTACRSDRRTAHRRERIDHAPVVVLLAEGVITWACSTI